MSYFFESKILIAYILVCIVIMMIIFLKSKEKIIVIPTYILFCIYIYLVINTTQFPIYTDADMARVLGGDIWISINLIPFKDSLNVFSLYNILLTMPLGFLVPILFCGKMDKKRILILALASGTIIEFLQLLQLIIIGFTWRVIDINDIIFNAVGVILGYVLLMILKGIILRVSTRFNISNNRIVDYFSKV